MTFATSETSPTRRADHLARLFIAVFTVLTMAVGLRVGDRVRDVDEVVFQRALTSMSHGVGYYPAMRAALVKKEGLPPSQIRSIRPPTEFLLLYRVPRPAWRWVVGLVFFSTLLLAWRLARSLSPNGGPIAVVLMGAWIVAASPYVYLHGELWGLPLLMAGVLALRKSRWAQAAAFLLAASLIRETFVLAFLAGFLVTKDRRWWWPALATLSVLGGLHAWLASQILAKHGMETPFGASGLSWHYILSAISPGDQPIGWTVGVLGGGLGLYGLWCRCGEDRGARVVLAFAAAMYPASILIGRSYWGLAFAPAVVVFAPVAGARLFDRARALAASVMPRRARATSS